MMEHFLALVFLILSMVVIILQIIALLSLTKRNIPNLTGSQKYLLIALCLTELNFGVALYLYIIGVLVNFTDRILQQLYIYQMIPLYFMYLSIMIIFTLDRFLEFHLNIKYSLVWSPKKTLILLGSLSCLSVTIFICLLPVSSEVYGHSGYIIAYIFTPAALIYLVLVSLTYYQIFKKIKENRNHSRKLKEHINKEKLNASKRRIQVFLPSLIILTFILFNIIPILLELLHYFFFPKARWFMFVLTMLYQIGWMADPLIYIISLKAIRQDICHNLSTFKNYNATEDRAVTLHSLGQSKNL